MLLPPGNFTYSQEEYVFSICPACGKRDHFTWNINKKVGRCWVCDHVIVGEENMLAQVGGCIEYYVSTPLAKNYQTIKERGDFHYGNAWDNKGAREFLIERNIDEYLSKVIPIKYCSKSDVISIQVESITPEFPPYSLYRYPSSDSFWIMPKGVKSKYYGFNVEKFSNKKVNGLVLCEGIFDILSSGLYNYGIALCGSSMDQSWCIWLAEHTNRVLIWLDPDSAGKKGANKISSLLSIWGIEHKVLNTSKEPKNLRYKENKEDAKIIAEILAYIS
jgi:5S rRNA maturation endonuclease (ribonuclease M5)